MFTSVCLCVCVYTSFVEIISTGTLHTPAQVTAQIKKIKAPHHIRIICILKISIRINTEVSAGQYKSQNVQ